MVPGWNRQSGQENRECSGKTNMVLKMLRADIGCIKVHAAAEQSATNALLRANDDDEEDSLLYLLC